MGSQSRADSNPGITSNPIHLTGPYTGARYNEYIFSDGVSDDFGEISYFKTSGLITINAGLTNV